MTKGQVQLPVGVIHAEGGLAAGRAAREAQGLEDCTAKARGRILDLRGLLLAPPPRSHRDFKN